MTSGYTRYTPVDRTPALSSTAWLMVAGRSFLAAAPTTVTDAVLDALWWLADSDVASIESVVGAFPLSGDDAVTSFAVATIEARGTGEALVTAVVRGSACVDVVSVGGSRRFSAAGVEPWVLAEFRSVTGLVIGESAADVRTIGAASAGSLPLGSGVAEAGALIWSLAPVPRAPRSPAVLAQAPVVHHSRPEPDPDETVIRARVPKPVHRAQDAPIDDTVLRVDRPRVADEPMRATLGVCIGGADPIDLVVPILIGRDPHLPRVHAGALSRPRLLSVPSRTKQVSATHVRIEQIGETVVVTDLRSTNGTRVTPSGASMSRLRPGESIVVRAGARVDIGDGNIIEITPVRDDR